MAARPRVAIVGSGPAGCSAALTLVRAGVFDVVVLEQGCIGKDKSCGDAFLPEACTWLVNAGVDVPRLAMDCGLPFRTIDLWSSDSSLWRIPLAEDGWVIPRARVDQALRDLVSDTAIIQYDTAVQSIDPVDRNRWQLRLRRAGWNAAIESDAVIIATGATNRLSRRFGVDGHPFVGASVSTYIRNVDVDSPRFQFLPGELAGYGWVFPIGTNRANAGYCATRSSASLRGTAERYLRRWVKNESLTFRSGAGPMWSGSGERWHENRGIVSCGDAAGLVDPLTGEGITAALKSGEAAGHAIAKYLEHRDSNRLSEYSLRLASMFRDSYRNTPPRRVWAALAQTSYGAC